MYSHSYAKVIRYGTAPEHIFKNVTDPHILVDFLEEHEDWRGPLLKRQLGMDAHPDAHLYQYGGTSHVPMSADFEGSGGGARLYMTPSKPFGTTDRSSAPTVMYINSDAVNKILYDYAAPSRTGERSVFNPEDTYHILSRLPDGEREPALAFLYKHFPHLRPPTETAE